MDSQEQLELEQEFLRVQMNESSEALAQKIERLEEKVAENVENATASVADATASVMESVQSATASVSETVDSVTGAVQGTVNSVRQSFEETIDSVKRAFDWKQQFEKHPYLVLAGAVAVGYVGGRLFSAAPTRAPENELQNASSADRVDAQMKSAPRGNQYSSESPAVEIRNGQTGNGLQSYIAVSEFRSNGIHEELYDSRPLIEPSRSFWTNVLGEIVGSEADKFQRIAIGIVLGSFRDVLVGLVPKPVRQSLAVVLNDLTEKVGGTPLQGTDLALRGVDVTPVSK